MNTNNNFGFHLFLAEIIHYNSVGGQHRQVAEPNTSGTYDTYLDGIRVQRAVVVSPNVILVASSAEDAPAN